MKTRNGFVSNSSTSSFVCIAAKAAVLAVFEKTSVYVRAVAEHVMSEKKFLGSEICVFQGSQGNCDSWEYGFNEDDNIPKPDENFGTYEAWEEFVSLLKEETKGDLIYETIDDGG